MNSNFIPFIKTFYLNFYLMNLYCVKSIFPKYCLLLKEKIYYFHNDIIYIFIN